MFTGLIEKVGVVRGLSVSGEAGRLAVELGTLSEGVRPGDSVAIDGACLTATRLSGSVGEFDISAETLHRTTLGGLRPGREVNLERALRAGDRLGGHFVLGHVDDVGVIARLDAQPGQVTLGVTAPRELLAQLIVKGSVAVDGISLTLAGLTDDAFTIAVIPHTLERTTLRKKAVGDRVNLETDMIGKYVWRYLSAAAGTPGKGLTEAFLAEHGFR